MLLLQLAGADPEFGTGRLIFFSSFFSLSLVPLFSFFLLFTMPKFIRKRLVGVPMDNMG